MPKSIHRGGDPLPEYDRIEWAETDDGAGWVAFDDDGDIVEYLTGDSEFLWRHPTTQ